MIPLILAGAAGLAAGWFLSSSGSNESNSPDPRSLPPAGPPPGKEELLAAIRQGLEDVPHERRLAILAMIEQVRRDDELAIEKRRQWEVEEAKRQAALLVKLESTIEQMKKTNNELQATVAPLRSEISSLTRNLTEANAVLSDVRIKAEKVRAELRGAHQELRTSRIEGAIMNIVSLLLGLFGAKVVDMLPLNTWQQVGVFVVLILVLGLIVLRATVSVATEPLPDLKDEPKTPEPSRSSYSGEY